jgi:hypothetical protein
MTIEIVSQIGIAVLTVLSLFSLAHKRYTMGFVFGLLSEPFWLYSTYSGALWGMFIVVVCTTGSNIYGLLNHRKKVIE